MAEPLKFDHLLVIPNLRVQNANAISSPLTHGFPSVTAFLGLMWALERKTRAADMDFRFNAVGVTEQGRHLFVVFTLRRSRGTMRLRPISARYMHDKEIKRYEQ